MVGWLPPPRSSPACPKPSCTSITSGPPRRAIVAQVGRAAPGSRAGRPGRTRRLLPFHRLRALRRDLPLGRRPDPDRRGCPIAHLRGGRRDGRAADPLRRADGHAVHLGRRRHRRRGIRRGDRGRADCRRARFRPGLRWIFDIPGEFGLAGAPRTRSPPPCEHGAAGPGRLRVRRAGARRARGRSSSRTSTGPARPGCTASPTPARPPDPETIWDALHRPRRRTDRPRHHGGPRPPAARPPRRAPDHRSRSARRPIVATGAVDRPRGAPDPSSWSRPAYVVTVNTDDPPMFGTYLNREYAVAAGLSISTTPASPNWREPRSVRHFSTPPARQLCWRRSTHMHRAPRSRFGE